MRDLEYDCSRFVLFFLIFYLCQLLFPRNLTCSPELGSSHPTMNTTTATKHFLLPMCGTLHSISFPSPLQYICLRSLFIFMSASMWSKRLMKQHAACHLCGNNYMEMVFTSHCGAPMWPCIELTAVKWLAAEGIDCPEWFAFPLRAMRVISHAWPYLRVVSLLYQPLGAHAFSHANLDRNQSIWIGRCHFLIYFALRRRGFIRLRVVRGLAPAKNYFSFHFFFFFPNSDWKFNGDYYNSRISATTTRPCKLTKRSKGKQNSTTVRKYFYRFNYKPPII